MQKKPSTGPGACRQMGSGTKRQGGERRRGFYTPNKTDQSDSSSAVTKALAVDLAGEGMKLLRWLESQGRVGCQGPQANSCCGGPQVSAARAGASQGSVSQRGPETCPVPGYILTDRAGARSDVSSENWVTG